MATIGTFKKDSTGSLTGLTGHQGILTTANATTKEAIFDALARAELSATIFSYCFNSGSDIGEIENIEAYDKSNQRTELNPMTVTAHRASPGALTPVPVETDILDVIEELCTACFAQARGRWSGSEEAENS